MDNSKKSRKKPDKLAIRNRLNRLILEDMRYLSPAYRLGKIPTRKLRSRGYITWKDVLNADLISPGKKITGVGFATLQSIEIIREFLNENGVKWQEKS